LIKRAKGLRSLEYKGSSVASFIASVTQSGYTQQSNQSYLKKSLPKLELKYTEVRVDETVHEIDFESIKNLPYGVDGTNYQWVDLDGEGLTGILSEQADGWYYKRNLGNGTFWPNRAGRAEAVPRRVECVNNCSIAGKGRLDLVRFDGPMAGFHERTPEGGWKGFTRFKSVPNINTKDPNLRFVDITADGHPDIVRIRYREVFYWPNSG
jgi:hypothetical protein